MRVVIADAHLTVRLGLKGLLLTTDIRVVGESEDSEEAIRLVEELRPDLVILGLNLTGRVDGEEVCRRMKALPEPPRILVHAACDFADEVLSSCFSLGADSYVHKHTCSEQLMDAVRRTAAGERIWIPGGMAGKLRSRARAASKGVGLTPKEREVFALMVHPFSNSEIAEELHLSLPTVKTHVKNVLRKLGVENRRELLRSPAPP